MVGASKQWKKKLRLDIGYSQALQPHDNFTVKNGELRKLVGIKKAISIARLCAFSKNGFRSPCNLVTAAIG